MALRRSSRIRDSAAIRLARGLNIPDKTQSRGQPALQNREGKSSFRVTPQVRFQPLA